MLKNTLPLLSLATLTLGCPRIQFSGEHSEDSSTGSTPNATSTDTTNAPTASSSTSPDTTEQYDQTTSGVIGATTTTETTGSEHETTTNTGFGTDDNTTSIGQLYICGNGVAEGYEECDDANLDNTDECIDDCKMATCGDGFIQAGVEQCDDVNTDNNDGCYENCHICGDAIQDFDFDEECDHGGFNSDDPTAFCTKSCLRNARHAFITSTTQNGNLGGIVGADEICDELAQGNSGFLGPKKRIYKAWISVRENDETLEQNDAETPLTRFNFQCTKPYYTTAKQPQLIAKDIKTLTTSGPAAPIIFDEFGTQQVTDSLVWTRTNRNGNLTIGISNNNPEPIDHSDCGDWAFDWMNIPIELPDNFLWSEDFNEGFVGYATTIPPQPLDPNDDVEDFWDYWDDWTDYGSVVCSTSAKLYCFEQCD